MKHILVLILCLFCISFLSAQNSGVGINSSGNSPDASAMLDIQSTDKGLLIPRMTSTQRIGINNPAEGLMVFDTDINFTPRLGVLVHGIVGYDVFAY